MNDPHDIDRDDIEDDETLDAFNQDWDREVAREEGMLGGLDAYNDYMGNYYEPEYDGYDQDY
jgi:hypothetical protein